MSLSLVEAEDLAQRAKARATGANVHAVAGVSCALRDACWLVENRPAEADVPRAVRGAPEVFETLRQYAERYERILRAFLHHGDLERARRENAVGAPAGGTQ